MESLRSILLVEDSAADAEMTIDTLEEMSIDSRCEVRLANPIVHVEDGVEALEYLYCRGPWARRLPVLPALLLLDIKMPRMGGLELLQKLREDDTFKHLTVVLLSSSKEQRDLALGWNLGVSTYLFKPLEADRFFNAVRASDLFWTVPSLA